MSRTDVKSLNGSDRRARRAYSQNRVREGDRSGQRRSNSWLITYADLMTILVCFFVLIVSFSIQDQVKLEVVAGSMRNAFGVAEERRYAGDFKLDGTPDQLQPGNIVKSEVPTANAITPTLTANPAAGSTGYDGAYENSLEKTLAENALFEKTQERIENAILTHPLLKDQSEAITIMLTEEGLQIIAVDLDGLPMFALGSATPTPRANILLSELAAILVPLPNRITVAGHADASGKGGYSPFELTSNRANAARKILQRAGLSQDRIVGVVGHGVAKPLYEDDPFAAGNRRIEIILERAAPLLPPNRSL